MEQCERCQCYVGNCEGEVLAQMNEAGIECSLEQQTISTEACKFFQKE
jgi:hypothetical protein